MGKVVIIGCGNVGITYAYSLICNPMNIREIVLIDPNKEKLIGDYLDLCHSIHFGSNDINIKMGEYRDIENADIICITAGAKQGKNKTRLDDINEACTIFKDITDNLKKYKFNGIYLIASNPNDVMNYYIYKYLKYNPYKIIGSGISLDTSRLIDILSKESGYNTQNIEGYVLAEHGMSAFVSWNNTHINKKKITDIFDNEKLEEIENKVKSVSSEIVKSKQATYYGVATCLSRITKCILDDISYTMPISCYDKYNDVFIGNVATINKNGVEEIIDLNLNNDEINKYNNSVKIIKEYVNKI